MQSVDCLAHLQSPRMHLSIVDQTLEKRCIESSLKLHIWKYNKIKMIKDKYYIMNLTAYKEKR